MDQGERKFLGCSQDVFSPHGVEDFCTRENWQTAVLYLAQEMELLGLSSPCTKGGEEAGQASLDVITLVNSSWRLIQLYRTSQRTMTDMETAARRAASDRDRLVASSQRQKEMLELRERAVAESCEKERQASEAMESGQSRLKGAKEEVRRLMSVLLQRESKYSHEIRRAEQEALRLKERLLKVLVDKGEGRGTGVSLETSGTLPGARGPRGRWDTKERAGQREEELFRHVLEEMGQREEQAAEVNLRLESALVLLSQAVTEALSLLEPGRTKETGLNTRSIELVEQARALGDNLIASIGASGELGQSALLQQKVSLYEEKLSLYEQLMGKGEASVQLQGTDDANQTSERSAKHFEPAQVITKRMQEIQSEYACLEAAKADHIQVMLGNNATTGPTHPLLLAPRRSPDSLPTWTSGPLHITPGPVRPPGPGGGLVLGYSGPAPGVSRPASRPASRPVSRPGSQPGSRAPSVPRERGDKGRSPAASIISKRSAASRYSSDVSASLGRMNRNRPKSANMSPSRPDLRSPPSVSSRRSQSGVSRSPSSSREPPSTRSSLSLPRNQLSLRTGDRGKRSSGVWSKPPTPGPLSPNTSDSEAPSASVRNYKHSLPKSSTMPFNL